MQMGTTPEFGYSIKIKPGGDLISPNNDASSFIFKIEEIDDVKMSHINALDDFKQKFDYMRSVGGSWRFHEISGDVLRSNLTMLDLGLPQIVAACLEKYYTGNGSDLSEITQLVSNEDPLHINNVALQPMYTYKMKQFLLAFALGMTVSSPWRGAFAANGANPAEEAETDATCLHFGNRNDLEDYLFNNARFDTPSTSQHNFGEVYKQSDSYFVKLNLLVRLNPDRRLA